MSLNVSEVADVEFGRKLLPNGVFLAIKENNCLMGCSLLLLISAMVESFFVFVFLFLLNCIHRKCVELCIRFKLLICELY